MTTRTHADRYPVCRECIALLDPVTGLTPRCPAHAPPARDRHEPRPATPRLEPELELDAIRLADPSFPRAHDFRAHP